MELPKKVRKLNVGLILRIRGGYLQMNALRIRYAQTAIYFHRCCNEADLK